MFSDSQDESTNDNKKGGRARINDFPPPVRPIVKQATTNMKVFTAIEPFPTTITMKTMAQGALDGANNYDVWTDKKVPMTPLIKNAVRQLSSSLT
jgi:hypothetical protein